MAKKISKKKTSKKQATKKKPGLYANIHKAQLRAKRGGRPVRKKGEAGAPTEKDFRMSKKTAKKSSKKTAKKSATKTKRKVAKKTAKKS